ncbi:hypothetical protein PoB_001463000 [Plakobranchus ocellatus]|uniref:Uncharacterized protein n=1 Tax=Plakobranchus ocellatus TaxID=259542 RepID=A0AAV3YYZ1_9GAST|nr:hypothetical protein PoB_001463000 [Plakobranchus ocellatus]
MSYAVSKYGDSDDAWDSLPRSIIEFDRQVKMMEHKPAGHYQSKCSTSIKDATIRDDKGNSIYIGVAQTEMSISYSAPAKKKDDDCTIL